MMEDQSADLGRCLTTPRELTRERGDMRKEESRESGEEVRGCTYLRIYMQSKGVSEYQKRKELEETAYLFIP